jgi:murein DD-endopeptidase MepM/ murein hydrolase activator NlpD
MSFRSAAILPALTGFAAILCGSPATALARDPGGIAAPSAEPAGASTTRAGGSQFGVPAHAAQQRPVITQLSVPRSATVGRPPRVTFRIDEPGVGTVAAQVTVTNLLARKVAISLTLGWVHTGRSVAVRWPAGASLAAGSYQVSVRAHDHHGGPLLRRAHASGDASFAVLAPAVAPVAAPAPAPAPAPEPGVLTPAQSAADGAIFPVVGVHNFGNAENRFGAPRGTHVHQGQDVLTAEGTPVVAPLAGTVITASYQAGGAGYYLAEHTAVGFDFMFAHCMAGSLAVSTGQSVSSGEQLCKAGQTGDASTPHLHFEIWVGGWAAPGGRPIDPLPYLEAWEHAGA